MTDTTSLEESPAVDADEFRTKAGFDATLARYGTIVLRYALRLVRDPSDAEELVQETFLTLWTKRKAISIAGDSVLPWLLATCRNHGANLSRRRQRQEASELDPDAPSASHAVERAAQELEWVLAEIASMSQLDQDICRLCLVEGVSYRDASARLSVTPSAVAKRVERARRRLKTIRAESE